MAYLLPQRRGRKPKIKEKHRRVAEKVAQGATLGQALRSSGYSKNTSRNPGRILREAPALLEAIKEKLAEFDSTPGERTQLVRRRLTQIVTVGRDSDSISAAKLLGQDKEVRMWEPETKIGLLAMEVPPGMDEILDQPTDGQPVIAVCKTCSESKPDHEERIYNRSVLSFHIQLGHAVHTVETVK